MIRDVPAWVADYVGVPYVLGGEDRSGADCLGLCDLVIREQFGVKITPDLPNGRPSRNGRAVALAVARQRRGWLSIDKADARLGDIVVMKAVNNQGRGIHMGLVLNTSGWILHTEDGTDSVVRNFYEHREISMRPIGFYRHPEVST